jgi:hypothetical protein
LILLAHEGSLFLSFPWTAATLPKTGGLYILRWGEWLPDSPLSGNGEGKDSKVTEADDRAPAFTMRNLTHRREVFHRSEREWEDTSK